MTLSGRLSQQPFAPGARKITYQGYNARGRKAGAFQIELVPLHSPLLRESWLVSFPPLSYMLKSSGSSYLISGPIVRCVGGRVAHRPANNSQTLQFPARLAAKQLRAGMTKTSHARLVNGNKVFGMSTWTRSPGVHTAKLSSLPMVGGANEQATSHENDIGARASPGCTRT